MSSEKRCQPLRIPSPMSSTGQTRMATPKIGGTSLQCGVPYGQTGVDRNSTPIPKAAATTPDKTISRATVMRRASLCRPARGLMAQGYPAPSLTRDRSPHDRGSSARTRESATVGHLLSAVRPDAQDNRNQRKPQLRGSVGVLNSGLGELGLYSLGRVGYGASSKVAGWMRTTGGLSNLAAVDRTASATLGSTTRNMMTLIRESHRSPS
jgi:hypothetical protein